MDLSQANIFCTGGAGTLGRALARKRKESGWKGRFTVYSTDSHKHDLMRRIFPDLNFVQGDVRDAEGVYRAMVGHDVVIHAAAVKVIPDSERWSIDTYDVNVNGSLAVMEAAHRALVSDVLLISTDKACHAANAYGATKYMMEKAAQELSRVGYLSSKYHLVRYGNVLESTGSVLEAWSIAVKNGKPIRMTDPAMTRFFLSPAQAVEVALEGLDYPPGYVYIPKLKALSIGKLADYTVGETEIERTPLRPGEKMHETLLTMEETFYADDLGDAFLLRPTTSEREDKDIPPYESDTAEEMTETELAELLK